jgi:hypothetical protein
MIGVVLCGLGLLVVIAIIVGIEDALHTQKRRELAAQRRLRWESRQSLPSLHLAVTMTKRSEGAETSQLCRRPIRRR